MKKIMMFSLLLCSAFVSMSHAKPAGQPLDQMVAIVNDELITRTELEHGVKAAKMQILATVDPNMSDKTLEQQVLQHLINKKLQLQTAEQAGLKISDKEVDAAIARIASMNNVPVSSLYDHVKQAGMTQEEYRMEIHDQIVMQKLQQHEVAGKVSVTPEEINAYMKNVLTHDNGPSEYRVNDLLIPTSDTPKPAELTAAKARAEEIISKIKKGGDVAAITKEEANKSVALQSNDLGWRGAQDMPTPFIEAVGKMKKNEVSAPIQTGNGLHVLYMTDTRKAAAAPGSAPTDRKSVEAMLMQQKFESAVQNWMSRLRSAAFISTTV